MWIEQHLRQFDLNLLLIFHGLMQERSVSRAAVALGMSQPAVSGALARLRQATGDALFVRSGRSGMQPTPFAEQLAEPVAQALNGIAQRLRAPVEFEPQHSTRQFTIAMLDVAELHFMPKLVAHCSTAAPQVRIAAQTPQPLAGGAGSVQEALRQGTVDLAIGAFEDMPQGAMQQLLFEQSFVLIARAGHPVLGVPTQAAWAARRGGDTEVVSPSRPRRQGRSNAAQPAAHTAGLSTLPLVQPAALAGLRCVVLQQPQGGYAQAQRVLLAAAGSGGAHHHCASQMTVPFVVAQSDAVAVVPARLALEFAQSLGLSVAQMTGVDLTLKTYCFWHPKFHQDKANRWLRACLVTLFGD